MFRDDLEDRALDLVLDRGLDMDFENRGDDDEDEDDDAMNISETKKCYIFGQCQVCSHHCNTTIT